MSLRRAISLSLAVTASLSPSPSASASAPALESLPASTVTTEGVFLGTCFSSALVAVLVSFFFRETTVVDFLAGDLGVLVFLFFFELAVVGVAVSASPSSASLLPSSLLVVLVTLALAGALLAGVLAFLVGLASASASSSLYSPLISLFLSTAFALEARFLVVGVSGVAGVAVVLVVETASPLRRAAISERTLGSWCVIALAVQPRQLYQKGV